MRNKILLSLLLMSTSLTGFCTVWTVNNSGLTFTPATITINAGDTVHFVLSTSHNAREVSQATWNANDTTALAGGFQAPFGGGLVLPAQLGVGTHYFVCTPHASFGMKGTIIVQNGFSPTINFTLANPQPNLVEVWTGTFASGDIDGDGDIDLFMTGITPQRQVKLYLNDGTGNFTDVTPSAFPRASSSQAIFKDLDNDGDLDLYYSGSATSSPNSVFTHIYRNNGSGVFTQVSNNALPGILKGAAIADVDNDGDQDIVMTGTGSGVSGVYLNNGNAVFSAQGNSPFSAVSGAVAFIDMENDGDQDVIISGGSSIKLYQNNGSGVFALNTNSTFAALSGEDIDVADTDNDGDLDFLVNGNYQNVFYRNNGSGVFTQISAALQQTSGGANAFADLDNDGDQDLLIVGTQAGGLPNIYNIVYENTGNNVFVPVDTLGGEYIADCAVDDFTGDGLKDVIIQGFAYKTNVYWNSTVICTAPATPTAITGNASVCPASSNIYSIAAVSEATSYTWTLPGGWTGTSTTNSITATAGATSGNITVVANNACGASTLQTLAATVNLVDTSVTQSGITLTATISGATYQWINCTSNATISGQTNQSFTAAENGNYAVIITQNGCSDTSACFDISTVGIEDDGSLSSIVLYPNPSNGHFQFSIDGSQIARGGKLEIYTVEGKRIYQSMITTVTSDIDLSHQASGVYFVKYHSGQAILTTKIVLE